MTFERWNQIRGYYRNPDYHWKENNYGVTEQEHKEYTKYFNIYWAKLNRLNMYKIFFRVAMVIAFLFSMPIGCALVMNYYETQALENLTGKHLNYWDVLWGGSKVRANGQLQDDPRRHH